MTMNSVFQLTRLVSFTQKDANYHSLNGYGWDQGGTQLLLSRAPFPLQRR